MDPAQYQRALNREKFEIELEFIQCLANPIYLHELATERYFDDPAFLNYLEYLEYWREAEYVKFIRYPVSLEILSLLKKPSFRKAMADRAAVDQMSYQLAAHWATWREGVEDEKETEEAPAPATVATAD